MYHRVRPILLIALVASAASAKAPSHLLTALELDLRQYRWAPSEQIVEHYDTACRLGSRLACRHQEWYRPDKPSFARVRGRFVAACHKGTAEACIALGWSLSQRQPDGRPNRASADPQRAAGFFQAACATGSMRGCTELGRLHAYGVGVEADPAKARTLFEKACARSEPRGCTALGFVLTREGRAKEALSRYRQACREGGATGCFNLGVAYFDGGTVPRDVRSAVDYFRKACTGGDQDGCASLAGAMLVGDGLRRDEKKALALATQACHRGGLYGCTVEGIAALRGLGRTVDRVLARARLEESCKGGDSAGCYNLAMGLLDGLFPSGPDPARAQQLLIGACRSGLHRACQELRTQFPRGGVRR